MKFYSYFDGKNTVFTNISGLYIYIYIFFFCFLFFLFFFLGGGGQITASFTCGFDSNKRMKIAALR